MSDPVTGYERGFRMTATYGVHDQVRISKASEITDALNFVKSHFASEQDNASTGIPELVCEELLQSLLRLGFADITVAKKNLLFKHIEIVAKGRQADFWTEGKNEDRIGAQLSTCLLEKYADYFTFSYRNGVNLFRVFARNGNTIDLAGEIYDFYENKSSEKPHKPTDVLLHVARAHRGFLALSLLILLMRHLSALMLPIFVSNIINAVTGTEGFTIRPVIINILLSMFSLGVNLLCFGLDTRMYRRFARTLEAGFKMALVQKLQVLSMNYHTKTQSGVVLSKIVSDVQFVEMLIYDRFSEIMFLCEDVLFIIVVAALKFPPMLLLYMVIIPVALLLLRHFSGPLKVYRANMRKQNEQVNSSINDMLTMESLTRSHGLQRVEYRSIFNKVRDSLRASMLYDRQTVSVNNVAYGAFQGMRLLSLSISALLTAYGFIDVGTLVLFQSIFELIINNIQRMSDSVPLITQGYDSLISINEILYSDDKELNGTKQLSKPVRGEIEFRNVSFGYEDDRDLLLKDISFKVPSGGSIALVGKSGQGKSTILNLILGLYNAKSGDILIDGINICELEKNAFRRNVAVVQQDTALFSGTLWDNLVYGVNYVSTERVMDVIRRVGLLDFLETLPDGLDTWIQENGSNLSGGQRQRISIARALIREPKIILLDEVTSALDSVSEKQVQEAIDAIMGSCTVVMVAHRLSTLKRVDRIYRIDNGKLSLCESYEQAIDS